MPDDFPYPTPFEILRLLLGALDLTLSKPSKKRLDDLVRLRVYDPRELHDLIESEFSDKLEKRLGPYTAAIFTQVVTDFLTTHLDIASEVNADGVVRSQMLPILLKSYGKDYLVDFVTALFKTLGGPHPSTWFEKDSSAVATALDWLSENQSGWRSYLASVPKEQKDRLLSWSRGIHRPSAQSIFLLDQAGDAAELSDSDWHSIKALLLTSRAIDWIKDHPLGHALIDAAQPRVWGADQAIFVDTEVKEIQRAGQQRLGEHLQLIAKLQHGLMRSVEKHHPDSYRVDMTAARAATTQANLHTTTGYWLEWHEARWNVYAGNLEEAKQLYQSAHGDALFRSGEILKQIIEESLVVAASLPNPDRVFLRQLKWSLINFKYDIPSVTTSVASSRFSDNVEDWEITMWRNNFQRIFPQQGLFPGVHYDIPTEIGPLFRPYFSKIEPDYRHPNKKLKIGDTWTRSMPQLVWFAIEDNFEVCEALINRGASVNVASEVGDTPILIALESLNVLAGNRSLNDRTFNLFKQKPHSRDTINRRTQKKRLLPIISAVESGRPDVVETVLKLGADPNLRGLTDEQTALNICIKIIGALKNPDSFLKNQLAQPNTPQTLDSIRRQSHGLSGFTLDDQLRSLLSMNETPEFKAFRAQQIEALISDMLEHMEIDSMREIAQLLIAAGADVNAEHVSPLKGYTPFMLAAELDEADTFELMLSHRGDVTKTYLHPHTGREISLQDIARHFRSTKVANLLIQADERTRH
jgi:ankyrin repeat protein